MLTTSQPILRERCRLLDVSRCLPLAPVAHARSGIALQPFACR
jgi:hypothetical protein